MGKEKQKTRLLPEQALDSQRRDRNKMGKGVIALKTHHNNGKGKTTSSSVLN